FSMTRGYRAAATVPRSAVGQDSPGHGSRGRGLLSAVAAMPAVPDRRGRGDRAAEDPGRPGRLLGLTCRCVAGAAARGCSSLLTMAHTDAFAYPMSLEQARQRSLSLASSA